MTGQIPDFVSFEGETYALADVNGHGLFVPESVGLNPEGATSASWRGYMCHYAVPDDKLLLADLYVSLGFEEARKENGNYISRKGPAIRGIRPRKPKGGEGEYFSNLYKDLNLPTPYTGGMLIADKFIDELYVHMGIQSAWKYEKVLELKFEQGSLQDSRDVSEIMEQIRNTMAQSTLEPNREELRSWVQNTFALDYGWILWDYNAAN